MSESVKPSPAKDWLNRTVVGAGITSAPGNFCYETTTVILPGFLARAGYSGSGAGAHWGHRKLLVLVAFQSLVELFGMVFYLW